MPHCLASVAFESRLEDAVDEAWLATEHVDFVKRLRRRDVLAPAVLMVLITELMIFVLIDDVHPGVHASVAVAVGGLSAIFYSATYRDRFERAVRQRLGELGRGGTEPIVVSLHPETVEVVRPRETSTFPWREVESVRTRKGSVILITKHNVVVVRHWAFATDSEFEQFRDLAISLTQAARDQSVEPSR